MVLESRESKSLAIAALGALMLAYAFVSLYSFSLVPASSFPTPEARMASISNSAALPAGLGFTVLFLGIFAAFATKKSYAFFGLSSLALLFATYRFYQLSAISSSTDISAYVSGVVAPVVVFVLLAVPGAFLSLREHFGRIQELEQALAAKDDEAAKKQDQQAFKETEKKLFLLTE